MALQEILADRDQPRVILIGDEVDSRLETRSVLNASGWVVTEASTTAQAMVMVQHDLPDVIILDLGEPDERGISMLAELKSSAETEWIPVVVLASDPQNASAGMLLRSGAQDYVQKPCSPDELEARVVAAPPGINSIAASCDGANPVTGSWSILLPRRSSRSTPRGSLPSSMPPRRSCSGGTRIRSSDHICSTSWTRMPSAVMIEQTADAPYRTDPEPTRTGFIDATGRHIWVQLAATPVYEAEGSYAGSVAMATNLTLWHATLQSLGSAKPDITRCWIISPIPWPWSMTGNCARRRRRRGI